MKMNRVAPLWWLMDLRHQTWYHLLLMGTPIPWWEDPPKKKRIPGWIRSNRLHPLVNNRLLHSRKRIDSKTTSLSSIDWMSLRRCLKSKKKVSQSTSIKSLRKTVLTDVTVTPTSRSQMNQDPSTRRVWQDSHSRWMQDSYCLCKPIATICRTRFRRVSRCR